MFGDFTSLEWLATEEELLSFLRLWGWLFAITYTLYLIRHFFKWIGRVRRRRHLRKEEKRAAKRR